MKNRKTIGENRKDGRERKAAIFQIPDKYG